MSWDAFHERDYRVIALDTDMVADLKMYVREKGILTPGQGPDPCVCFRNQRGKKMHS